MIEPFIEKENEGFVERLARFYRHLVWQSKEQKELTEDMQQYFESQQPDTLEELEQCFTELGDAIKHKQKYFIIQSIEKGNELLDQLPPEEAETRKRYGFRLKKLAEELERIS